MPVPRAQLAAALKALQRVQAKRAGVVVAGDLSDAHRQRLVEDGFLRPVIKGWYVCSDPRVQAGDSTAWYAGFWTFLAAYLRTRFAKRYVLNVTASILRHTQSTVVPSQVVAVVAKGGTSQLQLPHGTSLLAYQDAAHVPKVRAEVQGLQVWPLAQALCQVDAAFFRTYPREAEIALSMVRDPAELLSILLAEGGMPTQAGRLAGALRFVGRPGDADRLLETMALARYKVTETNPFAIPVPTLQSQTARSPYVLRLRSMWAGWRQAVLDIFPPAPGLPPDPGAYLAQVAENYAHDAYNSLSIEGYLVTDSLIARVASGRWNPDEAADRQSRDALAARGYYQAFQAVTGSLAAILHGQAAGQVVGRDHHRWYGELFAPSVSAGILQPQQLAGYRTAPVYIRGSLHTPPPHDALTDCMDTLLELLHNEPESSVRAVLGHHLFAFIHPYVDGNGRTARFLMNAMLGSGGYPWTVIRVARRTEYLAALESASVAGDIRPFAAFVLEEMQAGKHAV